MATMPKLKHYCEMCGKRDAERSLHPVVLAIGLDPSHKLRTLCNECSNGSMLLLAERRDVSSALGVMDTLAEYLAESHQDDLLSNHGGDGRNGCSYCEALQDAKAVKREILKGGR